MDTELAKTIGRNARAARSRLGLTQPDAAERIGISVEFYARIERGGTLPSVPTLVRMADGLEVGADVLLGRAGRPARPSGGPPQPEGGKEMRLLLRRLRRASPKTIRLLNVLAAALEQKA